MNAETSAPVPFNPARSKFTCLAVALVILAAVAERAWLLFSTPLVPGINGAYYLIQTRALIEQGKLGIPDLPLTFWIDASLAKIIQFFAGAPLESSILLSVKLEDAILPALIALPMFALVRRWSSRVGAGLWLPTCAALAAACGAPALMVVGELGKNSLGLVWLAALLWRLHVWLEEPKMINAALVVAFLALLGLTHIGVFGWALALAGLTMMVALWRCEPLMRRKLLLWLLIGGTASSLAAGLVLWKFDPARVHRLTNAITHPLTFLGNDQGKRGQPKQRPAGQNDFHPQPSNDNVSRDFRPPGQGNPMDQFEGLRWAFSAAFLTVAIGALSMVWYRRHKLSAADIAVVTGCALGLIVLGGPWVTGDKGIRFVLIACVPATAIAAFALAQLPLPKLRNTIMALIVFAMVGTGIRHVKQGGQPVITLAAADELRSLADDISAPKKTLIVARHGLEWWTAWFLHTHIAHADALKDSDWQNYQQIFFLRQKAGMQVPLGPRPGNGQLPPDRSGRGFAGGPPHRGNVSPPGSPPGGGSMSEPAIPDNAEFTHDGECFTLARVNSPIGR